MLKPLAEQVVVITGASSGIDLATLKMACVAGAAVVLAARNEEMRAATHPTSTLLALGAVGSALALAFTHLIARSNDGARRPKTRKH